MSDNWVWGHIWDAWFQFVSWLNEHVEPWFGISGPAAPLLAAYSVWWPVLEITKTVNCIHAETRNMRSHEIMFQNQSRVVSFIKKCASGNCFSGGIDSILSETRIGNVFLGDWPLLGPFLRQFTDVFGNCWSSCSDSITEESKTARFPQNLPQRGKLGGEAPNLLESGVAVRSRENLWGAVCGVPFFDNKWYSTQL